MSPERSSFFRFLTTFGILFLLLLILLTVAYNPLKKHILVTQQITALQAKSRVLGYQTPDFKQLAQNLQNGHIFKPYEIDNWRAGTAYLSFFKKGSELFPDLFEMHYMRGICQFWHGDYPSAEASLKESLQINPVFFWSYYNLGLLYLKNGQIDAAIALLSQAQRIPPQLTEKFLHDPEAFQIIWRFMPDPENYIQRHLQQAGLQSRYLLLVALAVKNHRSADVHFDPNQWNPVFF